MRRLFMNLFLVSALLGAAAFVWGFFIEPAQVRFKDYDIYIKDWPRQLSGFTIAFLADVHAGSPHISLEKIDSIVTRVNEKSPDLVLLGGDYVIQGVIGGNPVPSNKIAEVLAKLKAPQGVFAVLGNHDWWDDRDRIAREFEEHGISLLEDKAVQIRRNNSQFWLAGISDYMEGPHDYRKALAGVTSSELLIAFTHSPDIFPELPARVALLLAGHTHGGQVYIPLLGRPIVPSRYGARYALGLIGENGRQVFITPGIGTSILPVRFLTPPEVSFLHIYP